MRTREGHTGQRLDAEIGLYDYRARAYSLALPHMLRPNRHPARLRLQRWRCGGMMRL